MVIKALLKYFWLQAHIILQGRQFELLTMLINETLFFTTSTVLAYNTTHH